MDFARAYIHDTAFIASAAFLLAFCAVLRGARDSMWRIAVLSLPGTLAHELAHLVVGTLLLARPRGFSVWPQASGRTWKLGSVTFGNVGLLNGAFVALAPLLLLPIAWLGLVHVLLPLWNGRRWGLWMAAGYLTATVLFAALPSFQDVRLGTRSLAFYVAIGALVWWVRARM